MISEKSLTTLKEAVSFVDGEHRKGTAPELVILAMIRLYGAKRTLAASTNTLRCGGVAATCTWSRDGGLLTGWRRLAGAALQVEARK